jgi:cytochrome P450
MPPMLLLLQDISSPLGAAPLLSGPRAVCIGNHFAQMEGQLLLALLAQHVTFERTTRRGACARAPRRRGDPPSRRI